MVEADTGKVRPMKAPATTILISASLVLAGCSELPFLSAKVPDVVGFNRLEAARVIEEAGFAVEEGILRSCSITRVINQVPQGGERLEKGGTVSLAVECLEETGGGDTFGSPFGP